MSKVEQFRISPRELGKMVKNAGSAPVMANLGSGIDVLNSSLSFGAVAQGPARLIATGLVLSGLVAGCAPKEPTPTQTGKRSEPIVTPTVKPTETLFPTLEPSPTPTSRPTEAPKPAPTATETLNQKWGKVWVFNKGEQTGGLVSGLTKDEERFGSFIGQITSQLEAEGESLKQAELFVEAVPKPQVDAKGKPKLQTDASNDKNSLLCAYIFGKTGNKKVYCATEGEKGKEAQVEKISDVFTPEAKVWGANCKEQVDGSIIVSCADGTIYKTGETVLGADLTILSSGEETMTGYLFRAVPYSKEDSSSSAFFLSVKDKSKLPNLPSVDAEFDKKKFVSIFRLASARFNVWESNFQTNNPYVGYWDLEKGEWVGEKGYEGKEGYGKLFLEETKLEAGEVLIGKDFVGLPKEEALKLLNLPENQGKMVLGVEPGKDTKITYDSTPNGKGILLSLSNLGSGAVYVPSPSKFTFGRTMEADHNDYGFLNFGSVQVLFHLSDQEELNSQAGRLPFGEKVYGHAAGFVKAFKDEKRNVGTVVIVANVKEPQEWTIEEVEKYLKEKIVLSRYGKYVFLRQ